MATSSLPSLGNLAAQLNHIARSGAGKELRISAATHQNYLAIINNYRSALVAQLEHIASAAAYGSVGSLPSANETKSNLIQASQAAHDTITKYVAYLENFQQAITTVFNRFHAEDQAH